MPQLNALLKRGYFPRELPPPLVTYPFADVVTGATPLPNQFQDPSIATRFCRHDIPSKGIRRRQTGLPNPLSYFNLSHCLIDNWDTLEQHWRNSPFSLSSPTELDEGRAVAIQYQHNQLRPFKAKHRAFSRYVLTTDISRFYGSIYTHSIPWALHTKPVAKSNRGDTLIGNLIDKLSRNVQDRQTIGIPIGPDSSLMIAEIILSAFDTELNNQRPHLRGFRHVDDFEFCFQTYAQAEETLTLIRSILHEFELELNMQKTQITDLPLPIDEHWVSELRNYNFNVGRQTTALATYFDRTFELSNEYPTEHVIKYSLARISDLKTLKIEEQNWEMLESFLLQCIMVETSVLVPTLNILMQATEMDFPVDLDTVQEVMNFLIIDRAFAGYGHEVSWILWAILFWDLKVTGKAAEQISHFTDPIVALLALDALKEQLIPDGLDTSLWESYMNENELSDAHWLLAYESNIKGWLPNQNQHDFVANDQAFGFLKENGVYFYNKELVKTRPPFFNILSGSGYDALED